jgi:hypothetical protein
MNCYILTISQKHILLEYEKFIESLKNNKETFILNKIKHQQQHI